MHFPLWRRRQKDELEEELRAHMDAAIRERVERGESRTEAEAAARREFGNVNLVRETTRDAWGWAWLDNLAQDLRYAFRTMMARPAFTVVAILLLALGIGANAAIFSLWYGLLHASLPLVQKPHELVMLSNPDDSGSWTGRWDAADGPRSWLTWSEFEDLRDHADAFSSLMATQSSLSRWRIRVADGEFEEAQGRFVSGAFFEVLGARPAMGRLFNPADDHAERPEAVISYSYWQRRFGGRPDVLGITLVVGKTPVTIAGVGPQGFIGETMAQQPDLWLPVLMQPVIQKDRDRLHDRFPDKSMWLHVFGRLKPGVTMAQAEAQANAILRANLEAFYGDLAKGERRADYLGQTLKISEASGGASSKRWALSGSLSALLASVGVLLLIACANLANLLLARAAARRSEIALRLSLGAGRGRLIRQMVTESLALTALGGIAACGVAFVLHAALVQMIAASDSRFFMSFQLNPIVLGFLLAVTVVAALLFGVLPAAQITRTDAAAFLKEHSRGSSASRGQLRSGQFLVCLQLGLSLPLLISAGLLARTVYNLRRVDLGFSAQRLTLVRVDLNDLGAEPDRRRTVLRQMTSELQRLPGVRFTTFSQLGLFSGGESSERIAVEGYKAGSLEDGSSKLDNVGPNYFSTLGVPILLGREILASDTDEANSVCVVNEAFVKKFFGGRNPLGMRFISNVDEGERTTYTIVGVARNAQTQGLRDSVLPRFFTAALQRPLAAASPTFLIRTAAGAPALIPAARKTVQRVDAGVPVLVAETIEDRLAGITADQRSTAQLAVVFGAVALMIAAIGLYGLLSYGTARRTAEIAIRIALGAHPRRVVRMILRETLTVLGAGLALGAALAFSATEWLQKQLYGVAPQDPGTIAIAIGLLSLVALGAAYLPARRAAGVDPAVALRHQ